MVRAFANVAHPQAEYAGETDRVHPRAYRWPRFQESKSRTTPSLLIIQLVEGLRFISVLRKDADIWILWNQTVHKISRNSILMMIFKSDFPLGPASRQFRSDLNLNLAQAFFELFDFRKSHRGERRL